MGDGGEAVLGSHTSSNQVGTATGTPTGGDHVPDCFSISDISLLKEEENGRLEAARQSCRTRKSESRSFQDPSEVLCKAEPLY